MNDTLKIEVLMIYFQHWGKEEKRIRKSLSGVSQFKELIFMKYSNRYEGDMEVLTKSKKDNQTFWYSLVDCLLPDMDHWVEYRDCTTNPWYAKIRFAEMIGALFFDIANANLCDAQMKNVDAIVALPVLRN
jgi:hypothetical protein